MKKVLDFLRQNYVMTIATCSNDKPRASVVEYYISDGDAILFCTDPHSIKANNIKHNNKISMSVNAMPQFVTIDGVVADPSKSEKEEFTKYIFERHPEFKDLVDKGVMKFGFYKIVPQTAYYNDYTQGMLPPEIIEA